MKDHEIRCQGDFAFGDTAKVWGHCRARRRTIALAPFTPFLSLAPSPSTVTANDIKGPRIRLAKYPLHALRFHQVFSWSFDNLYLQSVLRI